MRYAIAGYQGERLYGAGGGWGRSCMGQAMCQWAVHVAGNVRHVACQWAVHVRRQLETARLVSAASPVCPCFWLAECCVNACVNSCECCNHAAILCVLLRFLLLLLLLPCPCFWLVECCVNLCANSCGCCNVCAAVLQPRVIALSAAAPAWWPFVPASVWWSVAPTAVSAPECCNSVCVVALSAAAPAWAVQAPTLSTRARCWRRLSWRTSSSAGRSRSTRQGRGGLESRFAM